MSRCSASWDSSPSTDARGSIRNHPDLIRILPGQTGWFGWNGFGDWLALDGGIRTEGLTANDLIGTAFYAYDAAIMAQIADVLGHPDDAKHYRFSPWRNRRGVPPPFHYAGWADRFGHADRVCARAPFWAP